MAVADGMTLAARIRWAMSSAATASELAVLVALALHARGGEAALSIERLCGESHVSEATARRTLRALEARGLLARTLGGGAGRVSKYRLGIEP